MSKTSLSILSVIAFVFFHAVVTLPLAWIVSRDVVAPAAAASGGGALATLPRWGLALVLLVLMGMAFSLRAHVIVASAVAAED